MKFKTTNTELKSNFYKFSAGYGNLQDILRYNSPIAYTSGIYGWNGDVYEINGVYLHTGYRSLVGNAIPQEILAKYKRKVANAEKHYSGYDAMTYKKKVARYHKIAEDFCEELKKTL